MKNFDYPNFFSLRYNTLIVIQLSLDCKLDFNHSFMAKTNLAFIEYIINILATSKYKFFSGIHQDPHICFLPALCQKKAIVLWILQPDLISSGTIYSHSLS